MRDRFDQKEVWENLGLPIAECLEAVEKSDQMKHFRRAYEDMGVLAFGDVDSAAILENEQRVAEEFDAKRFVEQQLAPTRS